MKKKKHLKYLTKDFGANGSDLLDDSEAFELASRYFSNIDQVNIDYNKEYGNLIIPAGSYIIGSTEVRIPKKKRSNLHPYFTTLFFNPKIPINGLIIQGETGNSGQIQTKVVYKDNLSYGSFNNGKAISNNQEYSKVKTPGNCLNFGWNTRNVEIRNLDINGNSTKYVIGGHFINRWQVENYGILIGGGASGFTLENLYVHNFATDGISISTSLGRTSSNQWNVYLKNVKSWYNGRNALTWVGGNHVHAADCDFSYTGIKEGGTFLEDGIPNIPGSNLDIEIDNSGTKTIRNGLFERCQYNYTHGIGAPINIGGDVDSIIFNNCNIKSGFSNTSPKSRAINLIYAANRNYHFNSCNIEGSISFMRQSHTFFELSKKGETKFNSCTISSQNSNSEHSLLYLYDRARFENCKFYTKNKQSFFTIWRLDHNKPTPSTEFIKIKDCEFNYTFEEQYTTSSGQPDPGRIQGIEFIGNNKFICNPNSKPQTGSISPFIFSFYNNVLRGNTTGTAPQFVIDNYYYFMIWNEDFYRNYPPLGSVIIGRNDNEKIDLIIKGERACFSNSHQPLYLGNNARIIVKKGATLILNGELTLKGKIIVEDGAYLCMNNPVVKIGRTKNINSHIIMSSKAFTGTPAHQWNPGHTSNFTVKKSL